MQFRVWLESEYDKYRPEFERLAMNRQFPFAHWFPAGKMRDYIPLNSMEGVDEDIVDFLSDFKGDGKTFPTSPQGYKVHDYKLGLAIPAIGGKRTFRISKIIQSAFAAEAMELDKLYTSKQISDINYERRKHQINKYFQNLTNAFQNSPYRTGKTQTGYVIAFSYDPHDIAQMSTGRNWTSCMNLTDGSNKKNVYCEVERGGFVAYLIRPDDLEIKKPQARIHIRRFANRKGHNIAIPEETIYGDPVPGFLEKVKEWINQKQGTPTAGFYKLKGGTYSDTFSKGEFVLPDSQKRILRWVLSYKDKSEKTLGYALAAMKNFFNYEWNEETLKEVLAILKSNYAFGESLTKFIEKYPHLASEDDIKNFHNHRLETLYKNTTDERVKTMIRQQISDEVDRNLKIPEDKLPFDPNSSVWGAVGYYQNLLNKLQILKPIPEPLLQKVIKFADDLMENPFLSNRYKEGTPGDAEKNLLNQIIHVLSITGTDTPTVVDFYKRYLEKHGMPYNQGYNSLYFALARLGNNGQPLLPYVKQELEKLQAMPVSQDWEGRKRQHDIESLMYVIDSIESGKGRSDKYTLWT